MYRCDRTYTPGIGRRFPTGAAVTLCLACTILTTSLSAGLSAQDIQKVDVSKGAVVFSRTNLILASIVFAPLLVMERLEEIDESLSPATIGSLPALRDFGRALGYPLVGLALTGGTALVGAMIDSDEVQELGISSLKALALAEAAALTLKIAVGRSRPYRGTDSDFIQPFVFDRDGFSFPSGHTAHAFALATVLSRRYGDSHG